MDWNQQQMRRELKENDQIMLNMHIDTARYFLWFRAVDVLVSIPFFLLSIVICMILYRTGALSTLTLPFAFAPFVFALGLASMKDNDRKNISLAKKMYNYLYFMKRERTFHFTKEGVMNSTQDIRMKLGIYDIKEGCYETLDDRLVKVVETSSVNISLMSKKDRDDMIKSYESFLNDLSSEFFDLQIVQYVEPISLDSYVSDIEHSIAQETDYMKRILNESYKQMVNEIQKNKTMVSRNRYIVISAKNKKENIAKLDERANRLKSALENMDRSKASLTSHVLDNDELEKLIYQCIDYESAQVHKRGANFFTSLLSVSSNEFEEMKKEWKNSEDYTVV